MVGDVSGGGINRLFPFGVGQIGRSDQGGTGWSLGRGEEQQKE
jgi:hypothetical protein